MRKVYLILIVVCLSCSSDDNSTSSFDFPDWLIGTWDHSNENAFLNTYIVNSDNIILIDINGITTDYTELIRTRSDELIINEKSQTKYSYTIRSTVNISGVDPDYTVSFFKESDTRVRILISTMLTGGEFLNKRN